jgi:hypothetical protein
MAVFLNTATGGPPDYLSYYQLPEDISIELKRDEPNK